MGQVKTRKLKRGVTFDDVWTMFQETRFLVGLMYLCPPPLYRNTIKASVLQRSGNF